MVAGLVLAAAAALPQGQGPRDVVGVVCRSSESLVLLDAAEGLLLAEVRLGLEPSDVAASPDRKTFWVTNTLGQTVQVVDIFQKRTVAVIPLYRETDPAGFPRLYGPRAITLSGNGALAFVACPSKDLLVTIDAPGRKVTQRLALPEVDERVDPSALAVVGAGRVAVAGRASRQVILVKADGSAVVHRVALEGRPVDLFWEGLGTGFPVDEEEKRALWVLESDRNRVVRVDLGAREVVRKAPLAGRRPVSLHGSAGVLYMTFGVQGGVGMAYPWTEREAVHLELGQQTPDMAVYDGGARMALLDSEEDEVLLLVREARLRLARGLPVPGDPVAVAVMER